MIEKSTVIFWFLQTLAMGLTALVIPRLRITGIIGAALTVATLSIINLTIWDSQLFASLPSSFSLHTAAVLLANGAIFYIVVKILPGIEVDGFLPALIAPVVFTVLSTVTYTYGRDLPWEEYIQNIIQWIVTLRESLTQ